MALGLLGLNGKGKGREKEPLPLPLPSPPPQPARRPEIPEMSTEKMKQMEEKARAFEKASFVVKAAFEQWMEKVVARAEYIEACKQSDVYREKLLRQSLNGSANKGKGGEGTPDKKRRISGTSHPPGESVQRKRARKRASTTYQEPRTDDELAQRFKEVCSYILPPLAE